MQLPNLSELEAAAEIVHRTVPPTPQYCWPLLSRRLGAEVWVKHENATPIGAFKIRGGLVYLDHLKRTEPGIAGVVSATTGNHGQSIAHAATRLGMRAVIVVPHGNSPDKNRAMAAFGAELVEHGHDFQAAYEHAQMLAAHDNLHLVRTFHPMLVRGVATYSLELLRDQHFDTVYVPIGQGSGICGMISARAALGRKTEIVGVVSEHAKAYALSFTAGHPVSTNSAETFAGGLAVREPDPAAVEIINRHTARILAVTDDELRHAIRVIFSDTHTLAEGAGAAALAGALQEREQIAGKKIALIQSGGNLDAPLFAEILAERD
jgi:threonine dehydratase